jgi:uncharacterized protein with HEPN domain
MIESAEAALHFVEGRIRADFDKDMQLAFAVARAVEILGEAASKVAPETRRELASIP